METTSLQKQAASKLTFWGFFTRRVVPAAVVMLVLILAAAVWLPRADHQRRSSASWQKASTFHVGERFFLDRSRSDLLTYHDMRNFREIDVWRVDRADAYGSDLYEPRRDRFGSTERCLLEDDAGLQVIGGDGHGVTFLVFDDRSRYRDWQRCPVGAEIRVPERDLEDFDRKRWDPSCHLVTFGQSRNFWSLPDAVMVETLDRAPFSEPCAVMPETQVLPLGTISRQGGLWLIGLVTGQIDAEGACLLGTFFLLPQSEVDCR